MTGSSSQNAPRNRIIRVHRAANSAYAATMNRPT